MDRQAAIAAVKAPVLRRVFIRGVPAKPAGAVRPAMQPAIIRPLPTNIDNAWALSIFVATFITRGCVRKPAVFDSLVLSTSRQLFQPFHDGFEKTLRQVGNYFQPFQDGLEKFVDK